jgi:hypothetical protein
MAVTGKGKDRRGDYQGTLADASSCKHPGLGGFPGWQGPAVERRQATAVHAARPVGTVVPGVERAPGPVRVSCVRNVETLLWVRISGAGMRRRCGKPTVRGAEFPGRTGCPGSRCRAAERRQESGTAGPGLLPGGLRITGPDAGSCYPGSKER